MKAKDIKPGMVINMLDANNQDCYELVVSIKYDDKIAISHFDFQDSYYGQMVKYVEEDDNVHGIIIGEKRKNIIEKIRQDLFKNLHDIKKDIDIVDTILAMDNK